MLTAGSDTPAGRILGDSASAFNVTGGSGDLKNYYDGISAQQSIDYTPKLKHLDKILAISLGWNNKYELGFEWNSLFEKDPEQEAKAEKARAEVYSLYKNNGVMNASLIAKELQNNDYFENITKEWVEELEQQDEFALEIENEQAVLGLETIKLNNANQALGSEDSKDTKPKSTEKSTVGKGVDGKPDPKKQVRNMKPEGSKEIKRTNKEGRARTSKGTDKEQV